MKATSIVSITFSVLFVLLCVYAFIWWRRYGPKNMHSIDGPNTRIIIPGVPLDQLIDGTPTGSTTKWIHPADEIASRDTERQLSIIREKNDSSTPRKNPFLG
uniref:Uncharacterized protein n=1 Tax=viral metagenome TaxID=1070528 RepID=A0A6C0LTG6_9ZZZZ